MEHASNGEGPKLSMSAMLRAQNGACQQWWGRNMEHVSNGESAKMEHDSNGDGAK